MQHVFQMIQRLGKCDGLPQWLCVCTGKSTISPTVMETKGQGSAGQSRMAGQVRKEHSGKTVIL